MTTMIAIYALAQSLSFLMGTVVYNDSVICFPKLVKGKRYNQNSIRFPKLRLSKLIQHYIPRQLKIKSPYCNLIFS